MTQSKEKKAGYRSRFFIIKFFNNRVFNILHDVKTINKTNKKCGILIVKFRIKNTMKKKPKVLK